MRNAFDPSPNDTLKAKIAMLEFTTLRTLREWVLGDTTALARLQAIDTTIAALRAQITKE